MKCRPILFKTPMVQAILKGRKSQTRRVVKPQPISDRVGMCNASYCGRPNTWLVSGSVSEYTCHGNQAPEWGCPYGVVGDQLWVRETWQPRSHLPLAKIQRPYYLADDPTARGKGFSPWKPSIFMPRWASRITLEITSVRVERLQGITEADAYAEGITIPAHLMFASSGNPELRNEARTVYKCLWDSINRKKHPWSSNPWVWVVEFKRIEVKS